MAASGPSLDAETAEKCRGWYHVIAVNDAHRLLPFADVLYACDANWWDVREGCPTFYGEKWTSHSDRDNDKTRVMERFGLNVILGEHGNRFSINPGQICYGNNSGFQAVNLALLFGGNPIILVGFDMRDVDGKRHFFGKHEPPLSDSQNFGAWVQNFAEAAKHLPPGRLIVNATPDSALTCFPHMPLEEALDGRAGADLGGRSR